MLSGRLGRKILPVPRCCDHVGIVRGRGDADWDVQDHDVKHEALFHRRGGFCFGIEHLDNKNGRIA